MAQRFSSSPGIVTMLVLALGIAVLVLAPASAQEATPGATPPPSLTFDPLARPRPEECRVAPRSYDGTVAIIQSVVAASSTPPVAIGAMTVDGPPPVNVWIADVLWVENGRLVTDPTAPSAGTPADDAVVAGIAATLYERSACANAGMVLQALALYTDEGLAQEFADYRTRGRTEADMIDLIDAPVAIPEYLWTTVSFPLDVRLMADGRAAALVVPGGFAGEGARAPWLMVFERVGERWLIDGVIREGFEPVEIPTGGGTPVPYGGA